MRISTKVDKDSSRKEKTLQKKKNLVDKMKKKEEVNRQKRFLSVKEKKSSDDEHLVTEGGEYRPKESKRKYSTLVGKLSSKTLEVMDETNVTPHVFTKIADAVLQNYDIINEENRHDLMKPTQVKRLARISRQEM